MSTHFINALNHDNSLKIKFIQEEQLHQLSSSKDIFHFKNCGHRRRVRQQLHIINSFVITITVYTGQSEQTNYQGISSFNYQIEFIRAKLNIKTKINGTPGAQIRRITYS